MMISLRNGLMAFSIIFMLSSTGCSSLLGVPSLTPDVGIEANIGKNNSSKKSVIGQVGSKQEISVESLSGAINNVTNEELPVKYLLLMLLGWMLPSPTEIFKGIGKFLSVVYSEFKSGIKFILGRG